ncbi:Gfo/Idh/MocA family oxidoreductase [Prolixibacteraceae bacterium Z1-6]|uniref:Gfo/Idh/MocA family oxidoreductase n=1 Tax=Draconibacterium aestuarii TaxID=2998507 RepID=A0A9X3F9R8_9BACT|nr:Gfo/Idh/MocA family oxidoreductase [Prolixibacteraceae bacterium Z1-6]
MKNVRIAMIGAGYIADYHTRGLQSIEGVEVVAVVAKTVEEAQNFANKYGIKEATDDVAKLYGRDDIDAAVIGTPNKFHAPYAINFIENGKDVFLEKPMAMDAEEGKTVAAASEKYKQLVMVGHMWRFDTDATYIKKVVDAGELGEIKKTKGYGIHENWGPAGWFSQKELAGGGALADMGVHAIDTVRFILGDPMPKKVYAKIGTYYGDYDVDDSGIVMISWDNGTESIIESGWWQPHMDGAEAGTGLFGTKGYASVFPTFIKKKIGDVPTTIQPKLPVREEHCEQPMYTRQMEHFVDCIRTRKQPVPGLVEGQIILDIVDAAYKSSETGEVVNL